MINQLATRLRKGVNNLVEGERGELGKLETTGTYTVRVPGVLNENYVRIDGDPARTVTAINLKTAWKPRLPVRLRINKSGRWEVTGLDPFPVNEFLGEAAAAANTPPTVGSAVDVIWEDFQLRPGRIRSLNGTDLQVHMEELVYGNSLLGNVNGNLTTIVGTISSGKKAWIVISVDPLTNTLAYTKGTEYNIAIPLTRSDAVSVTVTTGNIKLWGYLIRSGATYLPVLPQSPDSLYFTDLRGWINLPDLEDYTPLFLTGWL